MTWTVRLLLFVPVLFLVCIVVIGQRYDNARDTLRGALRATVKMFVYTLLLVAGMQAAQYLFID
jgi:hypothetical protein